VLLIDVLTGLGGASQEKSAARNFLIRFNEEARKAVFRAFLSDMRLSCRGQSEESEHYRPGPRSLAGSVSGVSSSIFSRSMPPASE